jgi:hypothetical protein
VFGDDVRTTQKELEKQLAELREIKQAIKAADTNNQTKAAENTGYHVAAGVNGAASHGHRRGR